MKTESQIRNQILRRIQRIPSAKLDELQEFVTKLENRTDSKKRNLSYAGAWKNIDNSAFNELTDNLIANRNKNSRRVEY